MRNWVRDFLLLSPAERKGLLVAAMILLLSIAFRVLVGTTPKTTSDDAQAYRSMMMELKTELELQHQENSKLELQGKAHSSGSDSYKSRQMKPAVLPVIFDPNQVSFDELRKMQVDPFVASNIVKYRTAGGVFEIAEDLNKIYGMTESLFHKLRPFIRIMEEDAEKKEALQYVPEKAVIAKFELNTADTSDLMNVPRIGRVLARRILKYRQLLGGYHSPEQLWEVYAMDSMRFESLSAHTFIDSSRIVLLPVNSAGYRELISHPYMDKSMTTALIEYRQFRDSILDIQELLDNQVIDPEKYSRISPYLSLNHSN